MGGSVVHAVGVGSIKLFLCDGSSLLLENVLFVPNAAVRLISVGNLCEAFSLTAHFDATSCWLTAKSGATIASGRRSENRALYSLAGQSLAIAEHLYASRRLPTLETWHRRLGHANFPTIVTMSRRNLVEGMPIDLSKEPPKCEHCILGKQVKRPVPKVREGIRASRKLGIVHLDMMGPMEVRSAAGNLYSLDIIDDCTSAIRSIPLPSKSAAFPALQTWERARELETGLLIGIYRTDNGEFKSKDMKAWVESRGTTHQLTAPYTSAQNGRCERTHLTLMNRARAMRLQADGPPNRWDEFVVTAAYLSWRTPTRSLQGMTPYEAWYQRKPDISHLREVSSRAFVLIQNHDNPKIRARSVECVLIGHGTDSKSYRCYHRATHKVFSSYNVVFISKPSRGQLPPLSKT